MPALAVSRHQFAAAIIGHVTVEAANANAFHRCRPCECAQDCRSSEPSNLLAHFFTDREL